MDLEEKAIACLNRSIYFQGLSEDLLRHLLDIAIPRHFLKEEFIFHEGERALGFYFIVEGMVKIFRESPKGKEIVIHIFGPGEIFAEVVLFSQEFYPASAVALTDARLLFFPKKELLRFVQRWPELALQLFGLFARRLRELLQTIENLTLKDARERLLSYLWNLSSSGKYNEINLPVSKSQLALLLGVTPETLSRLFQKLREEGLLETRGRKVILKDINQLGGSQIQSIGDVLSSSF